MSRTELSLTDEKIPVGNRLDLFPPEILREIDMNILEGYGGVECLKTLRLRYDGPARLPSLTAMNTYVTKRRKDLYQKADERAKLEVFLAKKVDMSVVDVTDPRKLQTAMMNLLCSRIETIRKTNEVLGDPRYEKLITENVNVINTMLETRIKLDAYEEVESTKIKAVGTVLMEHVVNLMAETYKALHGEKKFPEFSKALEAKLDTLDYPALEAAVAAAIKQAPKIMEAK